MASYKNQHYIPVTYLEAWCNEDNQVVTYLKENDEEHKRGKPQNTMSSFYFYTITTEEFMILDDDELEEIFGELLNLQIEYELDDEQIELKTVDEFARYYFDYEKWVIKDVDHNLVRKKPIKNRIDEKKNVTIEKGFQLYEDAWKAIKKEAEDAVENNCHLSEETIHKLKLYISIQMWRIPTQLNYVTRLTDYYLKFLREALAGDYDDEIFKLSRAYFLKQLKSFQKGSSSNIITKLNILFDSLSVTCYRPVRKSFFTSDNPAIVINDETFLKNRLNGIIFPISPKLLIRLHENLNGIKFSSEQMNGNDVRRLNKKIKENCLEYYIKV